ncbi:hypothetical protein VTI28DRAFT_1414 [Corynascus sepedonium]
MASSAPQQNTNPPFRSGAPFSNQFTTLLSIATRLTAPSSARSSPSWLSLTDILPPMETNTERGGFGGFGGFDGGSGSNDGRPNPNTASSSEPFFEGSRTQEQIAVAIITIVVLALILAPCVAAYYSGRYCRRTTAGPLIFRRRRRRFPPRHNELSIPTQRPFSLDLGSGLDQPPRTATMRDLPRRSQVGGNSWADVETRAILQGQFDAHYRNLRAEGLNELGEPPPPYKADEDIDASRHPPPPTPEITDRRTTTPVVSPPPLPPPSYHSSRSGGGSSGRPGLQQRQGGWRQRPEFATMPPASVEFDIEHRTGDSIELHALSPQADLQQPPRTTTRLSPPSTPVEDPFPTTTNHPPSSSPSASSPQPPPSSSMITVTFETAGDQREEQEEEEGDQEKPPHGPK